MGNHQQLISKIAMFDEKGCNLFKGMIMFETTGWLWGCRMSPKGMLLLSPESQSTLVGKACSPS